jgi:hypothetical protein
MALYMTPKPSRDDKKVPIPALFVWSDLKNFISIFPNLPPI